MVLVAGAGMAGLVAATKLRELGVQATVLEKGDRPGGSMLLSSGVVWRHRSFDDFRQECPRGEPRLQQTIVERLDDALDWLERVGTPAIEQTTGNPRTIGRRFDTRALTDALVQRAGRVRLSDPVRELGDGPAILATGGFGGALARRLGLPLRAAPWSEGDGLFLAQRRGAAVTGAMDEFYGRALPAPPARVAETDFVRLAQVYGRHAVVLDETGETIAGDVAWHENDLVQRIARRPHGRAWYLVADDVLDTPIGRSTIGAQVEAARAAGGTVVPPGDLPFGPRSGYSHAVHVVASVTHTIGGVRVDEHARVLSDDGAPVDGLYAAGVDAGGVACGGYSSGLAAALVLGLAAAESAAGV